MALTTVSAEMRGRFLEEWLACTVGTYPEQTRRLLREDRDSFRNPVGHTLDVSLRGLTEELFGGFDRARVTGWLDAVVHLRAVQDFSSADAVGFVALARHAADRVSEKGSPGLGPGALDVLGARIDGMVVIAADLLNRCREEMHAIGARAARRRVFVLERAHARAEARAAARGGAPQSAPQGEIP
jgi:hypothetical protein